MIVDRARQITVEFVELGFAVALVGARLHVIVQHTLVAEHVKHQIEQGFRRVFAQAVGFALFQRQHLRDGRGEPAVGQTPFVIAHTEPVGRALHGVVDGRIAGCNQVLALPVTALFANAAHQRHLVFQQRKKRMPRVVDAPVIDDRTQPRIGLAGMTHVAFVVALAGARQREQCA